MIDYGTYDVKPIQKVSKFVNGNLMDNPGKLIRNILFLRKHNIDTEDDVFLIGQKTWIKDFWTIGSQNYRFEPTKDMNKEYKKEIYKQEFYLMQE